jgi:hypothetical protein
VNAGEAVGRALAEIHALTYAKTGDLGADLSLVTPSPYEGFAARGYGHAMLSEAEPHLDPALAARIAALLDGDAYAARDGLHVPVLCHCDFKVSNLHVTPAGELVVLDWELAWGRVAADRHRPALALHPPEPFVCAFVDAYRAGGGVLIDGWRSIAEAIDVGSMLGVFAHNEVERRLTEIVAGEH